MGNGDDPQFLPLTQLERLLRSLRDAGYDCIGPQLKDGAILYQSLESIHDLPHGLSDLQSPGSYRLTENQGGRLFDWANGPSSLKPLIFPPHENLWRANKGSDGGIEFSSYTPDIAPLAVLGVRACDLAAMERMDHHFLRPEKQDPWYRKRRESLLLIVVNCSHPSDNCFCTSTGTGPESRSGYDLRLHELDDGFLIDAATDRGEEILQKLELSPAAQQMVEEAKEELERAATVQGQAVAVDDFRPIFSGREDDPIWERIAERCLGCGNCTAVCPTCFCHREEKIPTLSLDSSTHQRVWDSCFTAEHSMLHGQPVRREIRERYRQWLTHKLAGWHDQFGESGCVGCGRCITWCPVGINLVAESAAFAVPEEGVE